MMHAKYANEHFIKSLQKENSKLREQNSFLRKNLSLITNQVKLIEYSEKEYKELKKENRKLKKEISKFLRDIDIYDKLLSTMKNTVKKLISWVSSVFKVPEDKLVIGFEDETDTHLDPFEQLLAEDEDIRKELDKEYLQ